MVAEVYIRELLVGAQTAARHQGRCGLRDRRTGSGGGRRHILAAAGCSRLGRAGRVEEVGSILRELLAIHDPALPTGVAFAVGGVYAAQGDGDNAVIWLNKGIEEGFPPGLHFMFPPFDPIRGHAGFAGIVERVGLPAVWAEAKPGYVPLSLSRRGAPPGPSSRICSRFPDPRRILGT